MEDRLCINGPYDTGMWRMSARPENPPGISDEVMSAFLSVSLASHTMVHALFHSAQLQGF